jgi:endonuclease YncB( thermonuclease family)
MLRAAQYDYRTSSRLRTSGVLSLLIAVGIAGCANLVLTPSDKILEGRGIAADGDSIRIENTRIRLKGIDAPELDQICRRGGQTYLCGENARDTLLSLILHNQITCKSAGRDKYKRILATCSVGDVDLGARMVASGWALSYGDYSRQEAAARARRAGLWAGSFDQPREWRRRHPVDRYPS